MERRAYLQRLGGGLAGSLTAVSVAGCFDAEASGDFDVGMSIRRFDPDVIEVAPGTTVVWKNTSGRAHTVTAYDDRIPDEAEFFASGGYESTEAAKNGWIGSSGGALYEDDTFEHTFEVEGEHDYFCVPHEPGGMIGKVIVSEDAADSSPTE